MGDLLDNMEPPPDEGEFRPPPGDVIDPWDLLGNLPVPAAAHDLGGDAAVRFVNAAFIKTFGYTLEDIPTTDAWAERAYPDAAQRAETMERWWAEIETRQQTGQIAAPREYRVHDKAGRPLDVLIGFTIHGNLVIVTMQDVTETRATQSALEAEKRRNEIAAHALTENMPAGAYTMVLAPGEEMAKIAFLSKRFLEMLDLTHDESAVGDPSTGFSRVHPEDRPGWLAANAEAFRGLTPFSREARVVVRGETRWIRAESVPRALADGSIVWEGILVDITSHKEAEQQLTAVLEAARAYTWRRDLGAGRSEFDINWGHLAGHPEGVRDMPSEEWILTVHPEDRERVRAAVRSLEAGEVERDILTYRRQIRDDRWIWLQFHAGVSERGADGRPTALSGVSFDISDEVARRGQEQEKQAELREELQRAQQRDTMAQVAGGIAHDLNNLIGLVQWTVDALEPLCQGEEEGAESLATIRKAVDMALDLTTGLGRLSRQEMPRAAHDMRDLLHASVDLLGTARIARHSLELELPDDAVPVWANPTEVLQVVVNLAINACDSSKGSSPAKVSVRALPPGTPPPARCPDIGEPLSPDDPVSVFAVTDTGTGISPEVLSRMFQRNFTTKGAAGTGIGLLIVASILQANHAALWVDTSPGQGTTMTVAWPARAVGGDAMPLATRRLVDRDTSSRLDPHLLKGVQALIVDDLPEVSRVLADMLESAGAVAFSETDPAFVKEVLAEAPQDWSVLVTDLHMPGIDGHALARFAMNLSPPVPVVLVTARPDTVSEISQRDFAVVLAKPVSVGELAHAVRSVIDGKGDRST